MAREGVLAEPREKYLADFDRLALPGEHRRRAIRVFAQLGFPTGSEEAWRFTDLTPMLETTFEFPEKKPDISLVRSLASGPLKTIQIAFLDGRFVPELSSLKAGDGVTVESAIVDRPLLEGNAFAALNTAFVRDAAVIRLREGAVATAPIHVLFLASHEPKPFIAHPRLVVLAEKGSRAGIVESHLGPMGGVYFANAVTEIDLADGAMIDYTRVQRESPEAFHVAALAVKQGKDSAFACHSFSMGAALARLDSSVVLDGEGADCTLNGLYEVAGRQVVDNHTSIDHAAPRSTSRELFKGILDGASRAVFDGRIMVRIDAQKTNASQTNRNLLLSKDALVHTKPQLEIFADDVKCRHGATIGQLDQDVLFYLRSRGIGYAEARRLLVHAFASEIVDQVKVDAVRAQIGGCLGIINR